MENKQFISKNILSDEVKRVQELLDVRNKEINQLKLDIKLKEDIITSLNNEIIKKDSQINELIRLMEVE